MSFSPEPLLSSILAARGRFRYTIRDKDGKIKATGAFPNAATTAGRNLMLNVMFRGTAASTTWYGGLIDNAGFSALAAADTMASHSGWLESTVYSNATRPAWSPGAASGALLTAAIATFNINAAATLYGVFVVDNNTKGGTTGTLWATGAFDATLAVVNTDTLDVTYETELQAVA